MAVTTDDALLCRLAGELAAVFAPWRGPWRGGGPAAVYFARRRFRQGVGLPWRHGGHDRDEREEHVEALGRLERAGLLSRHVERTKVVAVRLSDAGNERACGLVGMPGVHAGWLTCQRLAGHEAEGVFAIERGRRWVPEWALAGAPANWADCGDDEQGRRNRAALAGVEDQVLRALLRDWIKSGADCFGRVWYALTEQGRVALSAEPSADEVGEADEVCDVAWREGAGAMRGRLASAERSEREIGLLPLPASMALLRGVSE